MTKYRITVVLDKKKKKNTKSVMDTPGINQTISKAFLEMGIIATI